MPCFVRLVRSNAQKFGHISDTFQAPAKTGVHKAFEPRRFGVISNAQRLQRPLGHPRGLILYRVLLGRVEIESTTPGLKDVRCTCCSMPLDMELEHIVRRLDPDLYLMCCPVLAAGVKFVNKSVNKLGLWVSDRREPAWQTFLLFLCRVIDFP